MSKYIVNLDELDYMDWGHGEQYAARFGLISRKIGATQLAYNLTVVPPGKRAFPFHNVSGRAGSSTWSRVTPTR